MDPVEVTAETRPRLVVFAGLPGSGKSAVADRVAAALGVAILSVDPIEEGMHRAGMEAGFARGLAAYLVAAGVAEHLLGLGQRVIVEACNAEPAGRETWRDLGRRCGAAPYWVEVCCGDRREHRRRLEKRTAGYPGVDEPTWAAVQARAGGYADWAEPRLVLDSTRTVDDNVAIVLSHLSGLAP